jgi:hypothetical protein
VVTDILEEECRLCRLFGKHNPSPAATFALGFVAGAKCAVAGTMTPLCATHRATLVSICSYNGIELAEVSTKQEADELRRNLEVTAFRIAGGPKS